jgi:putative membrane protein
MLDDFKKLPRDESTKQYRSDQEDLHHEAVDLFMRYGDERENANLKAWAAKTRLVLEHHLQMVTDMNK